MLTLVLAVAGVAAALAQELGREVAVARHLADGEELTLPARQLIEHGRRLFVAAWTLDEGGGRPLVNGAGEALADANDALVFPRNFNRISAPDANSCLECHNVPRSGGAGGFVANVFVLAQRFDFATFGAGDALPRRGALDENFNPVTLDTIGNSRATIGMFGSGYVEMLARQITADLLAIRDALPAGAKAELISKGISFGTLARRSDGSFDTSGVEGLPAPSMMTGGATAPSLILMPFHQAGAVISLRQFTNNAFNHHHGIQSTERFGADTDADGDGFANELTRADVTATTLYQATLPVPGRVIPRDLEVEKAVLAGEQRFAEAGCAVCHVPAVPLADIGWEFSEPNPYNPRGNLRVGEAPTYRIDLNGRGLPGPRLRAKNGVTWVPLYSDLKLHDITSGPGDPNRESLNMHFPPGSAQFNAGNSRFLSARLWGLANQRPYFHHGRFTTLREAIEAHAGEAQESADAFRALAGADQAAIIEFLKSLQLLPEGATALVLDEHGRRREWPPN